LEGLLCLSIVTYGQYVSSKNMENYKVIALSNNRVEHLPRFPPEVQYGYHEQKSSMEVWPS